MFFHTLLQSQTEEAASPLYISCYIHPVPTREVAAVANKPKEQNALSQNPPLPSNTTKLQ